MPTVTRFREPQELVTDVIARKRGTSLPCWVLSYRRAARIWDLAALNSTPSLALHKEPEVAVGTMGIGLDYGGFGVEALPAGDVERILSAFPRLRMKQRFAETCCRLVTAKPETSHDSFLRDFGEPFVPGYKVPHATSAAADAPD